MGLKDFIVRTIKDIVDGTIELQKYSKELAQEGIHFSAGCLSRTPGKDLNPISFDIAVTGSEEAGISGGGGIKVVGFQVGGKGSVQETNSRTSRICFEIPLKLPMK